MSSELFVLFLLLWFRVESARATNGNETLPGCQPKCGNVIIPYPFGIGAKCSIDSWANINCNTTFDPPKPFIGDYEVVQLSQTEVRIKNFVAVSCYNQSGNLTDQVFTSMSLVGTPYTFSSTKNIVTVLGCDTMVLTRGSNTLNYSSGCISICDTKENVIDGTCSGIGCCETSIPKGLQEFYALVGTIYYHTKVWSFDSCGYAFLGEQNMYSFKASDFTNSSHLTDIPLVLNFAVGNQTCKQAKQNSTAFACKDNSYCYDSVDHTGYLCSCNEGYEGNPYLKQGCQDVNECNNNPCKGICTNTQGGYSCSCPDDSYGDGTKEGTGCTKRNKKIPVIQLTLAGIVNEGKTEQVHAVAELAKRCLNFKGEERPSMKEVAAELEGLRGFEKHASVQKVNEESRTRESESVDLYAIPSGVYSVDSSSGQYSLEKKMMRSMNAPR
ncbi:Wall-associated receptor kinase [Thalictrum thalictroides]|uniref:Wall-associated receptor kinase n=1 Tax=Thalictrum thalictroides TaxID=46969 RepID=A0A7J6V449_THATH|nr:Wall-associated receptor kinase [Thalictrum thalictroides]